MALILLTIATAICLIQSAVLLHLLLKERRLNSSLKNTLEQESMQVTYLENQVARLRSKLSGARKFATALEAFHNSKYDDVVRELGRAHALVEMFVNHLPIETIHVDRKEAKRLFVA